MKPETRFWQYIRQGLKKYCELQRIESGLTAKGIPDVSYSIKNAPIRGWIELKHVKSWPKRQNTVVKLPHYNPEQKLFLWKHGEASGYCWLFLKIEKNYLLFDHIQAQNVGELNSFDLNCIAHAKWSNRINFEELSSTLSGELKCNNI